MIRILMAMAVLSGLALPAALRAETAPAAAASGPSFDCARAEHATEVLICADPRLAALDREVTRLYRLAARGPHMTEDRLKELRAVQRGWIKGRNDCWKAEDRTACVRAEQVLRIHALRQGYADARADDDAGISSGPFAADCVGFDSAVGLTFVGAEPPMVALEWRDMRLALPLGPTGSGARYAAPAAEVAPWLGEGDVVFWVKGDAARFDLPGRAPMTCRIEDVG
ncbi:MAG: MliC family protein [Pseudomonadota bacterium]|nr:MliC family protein [Pseudomonadota bacterium]MEE3099661.1 MliC family protein [Pseudomonadota bacterium]